MGALEHFLAHGVHFELQAGDAIRAIGRLNDSLRSDIRAQKQLIIDELRWREFERLLAIVGPSYNTPAHEFDEMREVARQDLNSALTCYADLARNPKRTV